MFKIYLTFIFLLFFFCVIYFMIFENDVDEICVLFLIIY